MAAGQGDNMAHQLLDDTMFYVGQTPWHKLGIPLDNPPTIEEAIKLANLDWEVTKVPTFYKSYKGGKGWLHSNNIETGYFVTLKDDETILGNVSKRYEVLQNVDAFSPFSVLLDNGYKLETAGAVRDGRMVWILAKKDEDTVKVGDDVIERYALLMNSHDGSTPVFLQPTNIRVVCANTLDFALSEKTQLRFSIKHTANVKSRLDEVSDALKFAEGNWQQAHEIMNRMIDIKMDYKQTTKYFESVIPFLVHRGQSGKNEVHNVTKRDIGTPVFHQLMNNWAKEGETLWHAYNAVTEYYDHQKKYKDWVWSTQFGKPAQYKRNAFKNAAVITNRHVQFPKASA